jgi:hypothetical protein
MNLFRQLQPIALATVPQEEALQRANLDDICTRTTNAKWLRENCDVVVRLSDPGPRFCALRGCSGVFLRLAALLCRRVPKTVKN